MQMNEIIDNYNINEKVEIDNSELEDIMLIEPQNMTIADEEAGKCQSHQCEYYPFQHVATRQNLPQVPIHIGMPCQHNWKEE